MQLDAAIAADVSVNTVHYYRRKDIIDPPVGKTAAARYELRHLWQLVGARLAGFLGLVTLAEARDVIRGANETTSLTFLAARVVDDARAERGARHPTHVVGTAPSSAAGRGGRRHIPSRRRECDARRAPGQRVVRRSRGARRPSLSGSSERSRARSRSRSRTHDLREASNDDLARSVCDRALAARRTKLRHLLAAVDGPHRLPRHEVNDDVANILIAQFLFLEADAPGKEIQFYINSPGGVVTAGLAIYDTMQTLHVANLHNLRRHGSEHGLLPSRSRREGPPGRVAQRKNHDASAVGRRGAGQRIGHRDRREGDPAQSRELYRAARQTHRAAARTHRARVRARHWFSSAEAKHYGLIDRVIEKSRFDRRRDANGGRLASTPAAEGATVGMFFAAAVGLRCRSLT